MAVDVPLPSYSESMEDADVIGWLVAPGDRVSQGDPIAEIETDKATGELESPVSGVLLEICVPEGTAGVKVGTVVARIEAEGDTQTAAPASAAELPAPTDKEADRPPEVATDEEPPAPEKAQVPDPAPSAEDAEPAPEATQEPMVTPEEPASTGVAATALARRLAKQQGIDLHGLSGTGHRGRILKSDIEAARTAAHPSGAGAFAATDSLVRFEVDCEIDRALAVCAQLAAREDREAIPLIAVILRAAAMALDEAPELTVTRDGNSPASESEPGIRLQVLEAETGGEPTAGGIHVEGANRKSLAVITEEIESCSAAPEAAGDASGFLLLDVSALGIERVQPALTNSGVACLGVGASTARVVADDEAAGGARLVSKISCCLAVDCRAVETRVAARWLQNFRTRLEEPLEMLL